jgi:hypothetical protein
MKSQQSMMFGESLLIENSVDPFGPNGAGSKLGRGSDMKGMIKESEVSPTKTRNEEKLMSKTTKNPPKI